MLKKAGVAILGLGVVGYALQQAKLNKMKDL